LSILDEFLRKFSKAYVCECGEVIEKDEGSTPEQFQQKAKDHLAECKG